MILMANNTDNLRSSITATTSSRPNNGPLPSSGGQAAQRNSRDLLHPKVSIMMYKYCIK
jgi:hypothetical protein